VVGRHRGHHNFTVGQRRGLGVAAGEPLYVLATDAATNAVTVGTREDLATRRVLLRAAVLHRDGAEVDRVKLRYRSAPVPSTVQGDPAAGAHERLELVLARAVEGVAPGQMACLMHGERVVGWATIAGPGQGAAEAATEETHAA
jgi:tRNA-specific 2-thiouridylase